MCSQLKLLAKSEYLIKAMFKIVFLVIHTLLPIIIYN